MYKTDFPFLIVWLIANHLNGSQALTNALQVYTNYTGTTKCVNADVNEDPRLGYLGWNFQVSTAATIRRFFSPNKLE